MVFVDFEGLWRLFWAALGPFLGVTWLQGTSGPLLGSLWAVVEASWALLGWLLGRLEHEIGASSSFLEAPGRVLVRYFTFLIRKTNIMLAS